MTVTKAQAYALADLTRTIRPAWDTRAITTAIAEVSHADLPDIAAALLRIADNPDMRTPAALTFEGDHWHTPTTKLYPADRCRTCGHPQHRCRQLATRTNDQHPYVAT